MIMAGKLTRYGVSLSGLRRNFSSNLPSGGHAVYVFSDNLVEEGQLPSEYKYSKIPEQNDFPLPGKAVTSYQYSLHRLPRRRTESWGQSSDVLSREDRNQTHISVISHFLNRDLSGPVTSLPPMSSQGDRSLDEVVSGMRQRLECSAQECPEILKREFSSLFPGQPVSEWSGLTVVTLVQGTTSDMSAWSEDMEAERDSLTGDFISVAVRAVAEIEAAGYWADFIDPASGRPYQGPFTPNTLFETDERYRHFGFSIQDLGCCKVVSHPLWGTRMFLGTLFTNAPMSSDAVQSILGRVNDTTHLHS